MIFGSIIGESKFRIDAYTSPAAQLSTCCNNMEYRFFISIFDILDFQRIFNFENLLARLHLPRIVSNCIKTSAIVYCSIITCDSMGTSYITEIYVG